MCLIMNEFLFKEILFLDSQDFCLSVLNVVLNKNKGIHLPCSGY